MISWLARLLQPRSPSPRLRGQDRGEGQQKAQTLLGKATPCFAFDRLSAPAWPPRAPAAFARAGFMQNAILYRAVRMVAEAAASVPLLLYQGDEEVTEHPLLVLIARPNPGTSAPDLYEAWYGFLLVSGNAYLEAVAIGGTV